MMRVAKLTRLAVAVAWMGFATVGLWAQDESQAAGDKAQKAPPEVQASGQAPADYIIGADDTLHITVWKEPDMSGPLPVRPDGKISIPLLDDVQAAGMTPMQLGTSIHNKLKECFRKKAFPRI